MHFLDSTIHSGDGGSVPDDQNHQAIIKEAVSIMKGKGSEVRTDYATSQEK